jgi:LacI family transcriptional regulator, repressor for deo operon, udp, cdd, tsx, nupC, and nupG
MARRLAEVAAYAKVSEATVSRVLNDKPGVSEATRANVLTALDVLGYERPTQLRGQRARLVGLVLPELQNPIFPAFAEVVADALSRRGVTSVLCTRTAAGVSEAAYVELLLEQQVSGVIFFGGQYHEATADHSHYHHLVERRLPVVLINAAYEDLGFPRVSVDDGHATEQALSHLESLGHERIGIVLGPPDHVPSARKLAAFRAARPEVDAADELLVEHTMFSLEGGQAAGARLIRRGATAVLCASDILALGVIRMARKLGVDVPGGLSVVGFDDSAFMTCTDPPLTTVRQPIEAMGQAAVSQLMSQVAGARVSSEELLFEPELVVRGSTGPVRVPASGRAAAAAR